MDNANNKENKLKNMKKIAKIMVSEETLKQALKNFHKQPKGVIEYHHIEGEVVKESIISPSLKDEIIKILDMTRDFEESIKTGTINSKLLTDSILSLIRERLPEESKKWDGYFLGGSDSPEIKKYNEGFNDCLKEVLSLLK